MDNENAHGITVSRFGVFPHFDIYTRESSLDYKWRADVKASGSQGVFEAAPVSLEAGQVALFRNWRVWGKYTASALPSDTFRNAVLRTELERFLELFLPSMRDVWGHVENGWCVGRHVYCRKHLLRGSVRDQGQVWKLWIAATKSRDGTTISRTEYAPPAWFWNGVQDCFCDVETAFEQVRRSSGDSCEWSIDAFRQCYSATYQEKNGVVTEHPFVRYGKKIP